MSESTGCAETCCAAEVPKGWGLFPAPGARYHWSARAIYNGDGVVDLLWDRMGVEGTATAEERKVLGEWLDNKALPYLCHRAVVCDDMPYQSECREIMVRGDGFTLRADPRASYGYLYLSASVDPTSTEPTPEAKLRVIRGGRRTQRRA